MNAAHKSDFLTIQEYLEGEEVSKTRHEYLAGVVYAMAGSSADHNQIISNLNGLLYPSLRGGPCRSFSNDFKVHVVLADDDYFFYPDIVVICGPKPPENYFTKTPTVLFEVLSPTTARTDRYENFFAYIQIPSLEEYVILAQDRPEITLFRRKNGWRAETISDIGANLHLPSINFTAPLKQIYERIDFDYRG